MIRIEAETKINIKIDGEEGIFVFSTNSKEINGANPADKLAAMAYSTDKTVQCNLIGNISARMTGTVA